MDTKELLILKQLIVEWEEMEETEPFEAALQMEHIKEQLGYLAKQLGYT